MNLQALAPSQLFQQATGLWARMKNDIVIRNSLYLMASTGVMALFGFVFWIVGARIYSTEQIGVSSTLVNVTTMLGILALLGFDNVLVRYLSSSKQPHRVIDTSIVFVGAAAAVLAIGFVSLLPSISPSLHSLIGTPLRSLCFVVVMVVLAINTLTDSIFISFQAAQYILLADIGLSLTKLILPILLVGLGGFGLFAGFGASVLVATIISLWVLARKYHYRFRPAIHKPTLQEVGTFSAGTYVGNLISALPLLVLPILVTNVLGAANAAFFNLAMTIAAAVFIVPHSAGNSLFAEGAKHLKDYTIIYYRIIRQLAVVMVPGVIVLILLSRFILRIFGAAYATGAATVLSILVASAVLVGYNTLATITFKIHHRLRLLTLVEFVATVTILGTALPLMTRWGINGAALAFLLGQAVMAVLLGVLSAPLLRLSPEDVS